MPRRDIRHFKAGSLAISFGTLMFPLVCLVTIGLLLVSGKMFFLSGFQKNSQPIPAESAFSVVPRAKPNTQAGAGKLPSANHSVQSGEAVKNENVVVVVPASPTPRKPESRPQAKSSSKPVNPKPAVSKLPQPAQVRSAGTVTQPKKAVWMVQVGAYSTKASADSVVKTLARSGHSAGIFSGKTLHRVLVQAGASKQDASALADRLDKAGFPGAFVVSPKS